MSLQPYCDQIDQVEASVSALEQTAYRLDAYCKRLGGLIGCVCVCLCTQSYCMINHIIIYTYIVICTFRIVLYCELHDHIIQHFQDSDMSCIQLIY